MLAKLQGIEIEIEVGDWVTAGKGADADFGKVIDVDDAKGEMLVAWEAGAAQTTHSADDQTLEIYVSRKGAEEDWSERRKSL